MPPRSAGPSLHVHSREDEACFVTAVGLTVVLGDRRFGVPAGGVAWLPRGVPHTFANLTDEPVHVVGATVPAGLEGMLAEQNAYFAALQDPPHPDAIAAIGQRYGVTVVGPPVEIPKTDGGTGCYSLGKLSSPSVAECASITVRLAQPIGRRQPVVRQSGTNSVRLERARLAGRWQPVLHDPKEASHPPQLRAQPGQSLMEHAHRGPTWFHDSIFSAAFDGAAVDSWVFSGRYTSEWPGLPPGTAEELTIHGLTLIDRAGGRIQRTTDYCDHCGILVQLGTAPPLGQTGTPEATPAV